VPSESDQVRGVILAYHRVRPRAADFFHLDVEPERLRAHLTLVKRRYQPAALGELLGSGKRRQIAVTFDDGYVDNLEVASEILLELGVPATFFINSGALDGTEERFWDVLERIFFESAEPLPAELRLQVGALDLSCKTQTADERTRAFREVHGAAMHAEPVLRDELVARVVAWANESRASRSDLRALTSTELVALAERPGHTIGAHGLSHALLPALPQDLRTHELVTDKRELESILQREVSTFSYPFGGWDAPSENAVRDAGFLLAVTGGDRAVEEGTSPWALPRLDAAPLSDSELERRLTALLGA
jgi:peptidoglycan/xylan/chitin deacetylase (PgdA/CDA1 family)